MLHAVVQHHRHVLAEFNALLGKGVAHAVGGLVRLSVSIRFTVLILHKRLIAPLAGLLG